MNNLCAVTCADRSEGDLLFKGKSKCWNSTSVRWCYWQRMRAEGVHFREEPRHEAYDSVAVFEDLCGNGWDMLQLTP